MAEDQPGGDHGDDPRTVELGDLDELGRDVRGERHQQRDGGVEDRLGDPPPDGRHHCGDQQSDQHPTTGRDEEAAGHLDDRHGAADGRDGHPEAGDRGRVVDQGLTLEDCDEPAGQAHSTGDGGGRDRIRWRHHCAEGEGHGEADRQDQPRDQPDAQGGDHHQEHRQRADGSNVGSEVDQGGADGGGVEQRGQQPEQHHIRAELGNLHEGKKGRPDAHHHQQQRGGEVQPLGHCGHDQHGGGDGEDGQGGVHVGHASIPACEDRKRDGPA
jgi:hypothetical protein